VPSRVELMRQANRIESLILTHPEGLTLPDVVRLYDQVHRVAMPERTMLRRIRVLMRQGRVEARGAARATRYRVVRACYAMTG
jgi:hypothetical protein